MKCCLPILLLVSLLTLSGCNSESPPPQVTPAAVAENPVTTETAATPLADAFAMFNTSISVKHVMNAVINPNARELWGGVRYVETAEGIEEKMPQTQQDWDSLKANAIVLMEASNALMLPGRPVEASTTTTVTPDFQFTPAEIEQLIRDDPDNWIISLQIMQDSLLRTIEAIDRKDILGFTERGAQINESCEGCHAQYWYRPQSMRQ